MHSAVAGDDNDLSVSLLGCGRYTLRTHCDTLRKSKEQSWPSAPDLLPRSAARSRSSARRGVLAKLVAVAASATEHDDVKTVKPAVAAASCAVVVLPRCSGDEGVCSAVRERRAPDPREARGVGAAAPQPAVARPQELGA